MIVFKGRFEYSEFLLDLAQELSLLRSDLSKKVYGKDTDKYRGHDERRISNLGVLGELIAREHFKHISKPTTNWKFTPIVDLTPLPEPDLICKDKTYDVKTIENGMDIFMVNEKAFHNPDKQVDWYWFIHLQNNYECNHWLVSKKEIETWECKEMRYTKAYFSKIPEPDYMNTWNWKSE